MAQDTLFERFKDYYFDYRQTTNVDRSFELARDTLAFHVINETDRLADSENISGIKDLIRQFRDIHGSTYGSNDSVKERLEHEFVGRLLH